MDGQTAEQDKVWTDGQAKNNMYICGAAPIDIRIKNLKQNNTKLNFAKVEKLLKPLITSPLCLFSHLTFAETCICNWVSKVFGFSIVGERKEDIFLYF
jgi:hypothetical protein